GDEIGLPGGNFDPDTRRTMQWDRQDTWDMQLLAFHKQVIAMRHAHPALRTGTYRRLFADQDVYAFARANGDETLLIAINVAAQPRAVSVPAGDALAEGARLRAVYGQGDAVVSRGAVGIELSGRDGIVLQVERGAP